MATLLLQTKLYIPPPRPELAPRPRLIERLNAGLHRKLTLLSAPAGFGKTALVSEWVSECGGADTLLFWRRAGPHTGTEVRSGRRERVGDPARVYGYLVVRRRLGVGDRKCTLAKEAVSWPVSEAVPRRV